MPYFFEFQIKRLVTSHLQAAMLPVTPCPACVQELERERLIKPLLAKIIWLCHLMDTLCELQVSEGMSMQFHSLIQLCQGELHVTMNKLSLF